MPKQTTLDESAEIYQPRKKQTEKEKLKEMSFRNKLSYLLEYYKIHALVAVAVIALIVYIFYEVTSPHVRPQFYAAIINSAVDPDVMETYKADFAQYLQLDPERQSVELNNSFYLSENDYMGSSRQILSTYMAAGEIDVIIAPESVFKEYASIGSFIKLSDELPTDIYSSLTDSFFLSDTQDDPEKSAYGIYLTSSDLFKDLTYNKEPYLLGIIENHPHDDNTIEFIKYLFKK